MLKDYRLAIVGLGYVGLPLAVEFAKQRSVIGFDIDKKRISALSQGIDVTKETSVAELNSAKYLTFTTDVEKLRDAEVYIITVPTPIDENNNPDLNPLFNASRIVGSVLKRGDIVIYESTVYPGATEEDCVPILENTSGLKFNVDFYCGYSPERINPGDRNHRLADIVKVTSGSTDKIACIIDDLYASIITAGTYKAESIKIAEAAKVIENTQRDLNIALVNEIAQIFDRIGVDTRQVIDAAKTKWNFQSFQPGLVGGHCIGVDPYYLTYKAKKVGYRPEVILAGRRINDEMANFAAKKLVKTIFKKPCVDNERRVLVLGVSFKENCPDIRNTKVVDFVNELTEFGLQCDIFDPVVDASEFQNEYGISLIPKPGKRKYHAVVLAVPHQEITIMGSKNLKEFCKTPDGIFFDLKGYFHSSESDMRL